MNSKDILVIFNENGARIEKSPEIISLHKNDSNVLYNPELPHGVPPHYWIKDGDKIGFREDNPYKEIIIESPEKYKKLNEQKDQIINELNIHFKKLVNKYKILSISLIVVIIGLLCHQHL